MRFNICFRRRKLFNTDQESPYIYCSFIQIFVDFSKIFQLDLISFSLDIVIRHFPRYGKDYYGKEMHAIFRSEWVSSRIQDFVGNYILERVV